MLFLFSLLFAQKTYAIVVTNPTPNPFNPGAGQRTSISFMVDNTQYVTVKIVNFNHNWEYYFNDKKYTHSYNDIKWNYLYYNVYNSPDAVTYSQEIVKSTVARIYAQAGKYYTVSWDGTSDKGGSYNLCQSGTYYFVVIPEGNPQYTIYNKSVNITMWNQTWLAYIRQARTWLGSTPYHESEQYGPTVSRDNGMGTSCTGFVTSVIWEMGYNPYYGNFLASEIDVLTQNKGSPRGGLI